MTTSRIPLLRALADLRQARTPGTVALYGGLGAALALVASIPLCGAVQDEMAHAHHAQPTSRVTWAVVQVVPKMYSFSHRLWVGPEQHDDDEKLLQAPSLWVNHYPARSTRFETARAAFVETGVDMNVIMRSGYQGRRWLSRFKVRVDHGGLVIELR